MNIVDDFYSNYYSKIFGSGLIGKMAGFVHWFIEVRYKKNQFFDTILEVGAGEGQHSKFVKHQYRRYIQSDIRNSSTPTINVRVKNQIANAAKAKLKLYEKEAARQKREVEITQDTNVEDLKKLKIFKDDQLDNIRKQIQIIKDNQTK